MSALLVFGFTTAYLPVRLLLAPCCGDTGAIGRRKAFKSILITGASSGIGAALAESYAADGVRLVLVARRANKLRDVAAACTARGAVVDVMEADVTNRAAMRTLVVDADTQQPLDLVVANAGVQAEIIGDADPLVQSGPSIFDVNCNGVFNTVDPAIERFRERSEGHVAIMASIASYLPGGSDTWVHYMASKAAMRSYGEGLAMCLVSSANSTALSAIGASARFPYKIMNCIIELLVFRMIDFVGTAQHQRNRPLPRLYPVRAHRCHQPSSAHASSDVDSDTFHEAGIGKRRCK